MPERFAGTRVAVTGACGVIGTWIAKAFAREGARLTLTDVRAEPLAALADRLGARAVVADVTEPDGLAAAGDAVRGCEVLVNNAALYPRTPLAETTPDVVRRLFDVNVVAPFELTRQAAAAMIDAGVAGRIVNISSGAAVRPGPTGSVYAATKAAIESLTRSTALELAPAGIRVNAVQPGFAPGSEVSDLSEDHVATMRARIPLGRTSGPEDAPEAVLWLASDAAGFVTGTTVAVDGGRTAGEWKAPS
ncbi:3-oxoacyl-[acyl-carrier protein] reductase [Jatrophihabitans endophyticus]|uniref:3-oxoacyl-[acyl-carrier protein] reductase n=1 Tax=Jatrophihabitans endophyticus TaxID=1206085 RepID=A0A1M5S2R9_9ACTN|nr:SDR family oxidoreductase [Jatrophihabitans endophyticus]SHH32263.1 3-oxoacyl-[acyl-carrier protein] reductase [Jatrophihabitans endophyticus]